MQKKSKGDHQSSCRSLDGYHVAGMIPTSVFAIDDTLSGSTGSGWDTEALWLGNPS